MKTDELMRQMRVKGVTVTQMANDLCMNVSTFYRKLQRPDSFSVEQASEMARILRLSKDETNSIFFNL